jgi:hypothetical protein
MNNIEIHESVIPLNFGWRAGIGKHIEDTVESFEIKKRELENRGEKIDLQMINEYNESIWWSIIADIEDALQQFVFEQVCEKTMYSIETTIKSIIDTNIQKYPHIKSYSFQIYLKEIRKQTIDNLLLELGSFPMSKHIPAADGFIFLVGEDYKIILNKNRILNYMLFDR